MTHSEPSQSFNISHGQLSNVQIGGIAGRDQVTTQTQQVNSPSNQTDLTPTDVLQLLTQLEVLVQNTNIPADQANKAIKHIEAAKEEVQEKDPDKDFLAKHLKRTTNTLKTASQTVTAAKGLWDKAEPIVSKLSPWLGIAATLL